MSKLYSLFIMYDLKDYKGALMKQNIYSGAQKKDTVRKKMSHVQKK